MTDKPMTVGELIEKLNKFPDDMLVALINESSDVYAQDVERYVGYDGKLEPFVSIDGREWVS